MISKQKMSLVGVFLLLFTVCLVAYCNAFHSDIRYDLDLYTGARIPDFMDRVKYSLLIEGEHGPIIEPQLYWFRPIPFLISWELYRFFDGKMVFINFTNIVIVSIAGFILFRLLYFLFGQLRIALWAAIFFCVHPVTGIQINYHPGAVHCITAFGLMMLSLQFFVSYLREEKKINPLCWSVFLFAVALLFHEIVLFFPFYMAWTIHQMELKNRKRGYFLLAVHTVVLLVYLKIRSMALEQGDLIIRRWADFGVDPLVYLGTMVKVFFISLGKLITMDGIVINWCLPFLSGNLFLWFLLGALLTAFCVFLICARRSSIIIWSLGMLFVGFIPVCVGGLYDPQLGLIYEAHWMFFQHVGFFMVIAYGIDQICVKSRLWGWGVFFLMVAISFNAGWMYNKLYADEVAYAKLYVENAPGFKYARYFLVDAYIHRGNYVQAREELKDIISNNPEFQEAKSYLEEVYALEEERKRMSETKVLTENEKAAHQER